MSLEYWISKKHIQESISYSVTLLILLVVTYQLYTQYKMHLLCLRFAGIIVFLITVLSWLVTGMVIQLLLPYLPLVLFVGIGLLAGLLLTLFLPHLYPDTDPGATSV